MIVSIDYRQKPRVSVDSVNKFPINLVGNFTIAPPSLVSNNILNYSNPLSNKFSGYFFYMKKEENK